MRYISPNWDWVYKFVTFARVPQHLDSGWQVVDAWDQLTVDDSRVWVAKQVPPESQVVRAHREIGFKSKKND